jgi:hypothetical protein
VCDTCLFLGLERRCRTCGGFDWVSDVYVWEKSPVAFLAGLCVTCRESWSVVNRDQVAL